ncbi:MAG TPA: MFS transporter [Terriglobia bacterium]|nr:MFS transporter [Terriglobia bacterium]
MRWLLILWIFILSAVAYLDRVNISIAGASIATEYHLTDVRLGYVFSSFLIGYAVCQAPAGRLADRFGPRRVIALAVVWWGLFTALTASVPVGAGMALALLITIRVLLGAGEAVIYPASNQFVSRWIPTTERGLANGLIFAGVGAGAGVTPPLIAYIMIHHGWRAAFWVSAALGVIAGAVWFVAARDTPERHPWVSARERQHIESGLTLDAGAVAQQRTNRPRNQEEHLPWRVILTSREVLAMALSYFTYGYVAWIFFSWFFIYLNRVRGLDLRASAFFSMLPFLAMAAGSLGGGAISDALTRHSGKHSGRCVFSLVVMLLAAAFLVSGAYAHSAPLASIVLAGGAGSLYLSQSCYWSVTADIAGNSSGTVSGLMNMGGQLGGAVTASLTPAIADAYGWTASFLVAAGLCALGGLAWLLVDPEHQLDRTEAAGGQ